MTILLLILILAFPNLAMSSALSDAANGLIVGQWVELTTVNLPAAITAKSGTCNILQWGDDAIWSAEVNAVYLWGAGDCGGSGHNATIAKYTESTNTWTVIATNDTTFPDPIHGYDHLAYRPSTHKLYRRWFNSNRITEYSVDTDTWTDAPFTGPSELPPGVISITGGFEYFPDRDSLVLVDGNFGVWERPFATGIWTRLACTNPSACSEPLLPSAPNMGGYDTIARYSPLCTCIIFGGGDHGTPVKFNTVYRFKADGTFDNIGDTPFGPYWGISHTLTHIDPVTGVFVVPREDVSVPVPHPVAFWTLNPLTGTWTQLTDNVPFWNLGANGVFSKHATPIAKYGVIMYVSAGTADGPNGKVFLYKYATGNTFANRCAAAGVVRCVSFDSAADIANTGIGFSTGYMPGQDATAIHPNASIDTTIKASGTGSLKFPIPASAGSDPSGAYYASFNKNGTDVFNDQSIQFGQGDTFYYSYRMYMPAAFLRSHYLIHTPVESRAPAATLTPSGTSGSVTFTASAPAFNPGCSSGTGDYHGYIVNLAATGGHAIITCATTSTSAVGYILEPFTNGTATIASGGWAIGSTAGIKASIVGSGDPATCGPSNQPACIPSCSTLELVTGTAPKGKYPVMYNSCGFSIGLYEDIGGGDLKFENARPSPFCLFSQDEAIPPTSLTTGTCVPYVENEWMHFKTQVTIGTWTAGSPNHFVGSHIRSWLGRDGQASVLYIDMDVDLVAGSSAGAEKYGKIWLLPYMTLRNITDDPTPSVTNPYGDTAVYYDDLIISKNDIADPGIASASPSPSTPMVLGVGSGRIISVGSGATLNIGVVQ